MYQNFSFIDESPSVADNSIHGRSSESFSLEEIQSDLSDESESVRGHALIKLAKGIRRKNRQLLDDITAYPAIMRVVLGQLCSYSISMIFLFCDLRHSCNFQLRHAVIFSRIIVLI